MVCRASAEIHWTPGIVRPNVPGSQHLIASDRQRNIAPRFQNIAEPGVREPRALGGTPLAVDTSRLRVTLM